MYAVATKAASQHGRRHRRSARTDAVQPGAADPPRLQRLAALAHSFAYSTNYCSAGARRVLRKQNLSPALERVAAAIRPDRQLWLAWSCESVIRFFVAEAASGRAAIRLFFYDLDGRMQACGVWTRRAGGHWSLRSVDAVGSDV